MIWKFVVIGIAFAAGDVLMKQWANERYTLIGTGLIPFVVALIVYGAGFVYYGLQLRTTNFSIATLLPIVINILIVLILTVFYYHEPLSGKQGIGIVLGVAAIILLH